MSSWPSTGFDVAVVGAGILGLAHAYVAARAGKRVVLIERDPRANGASIRNFGFVTVTGQERGEGWALARRGRDVWAAVAPEAGIAIEQRGLALTARLPESIAVIEAFLGTEMGEGLRLVSAADYRRHHDGLIGPDGLGVLLSPHEVRVESRDAIPRLLAWLGERHGVTVLTGAAVHAARGTMIETARGPLRADLIIICPGDDLTSLFPERIAARGVRRCRLSMLRLASPGRRLPSPMMSDLGLVRYAGYAALPEAAALRHRLAASHADHLANGVHLIIAQSADGSLVVGDSHHYADLPDPFAPALAEDLILDEFAAATGLAPPRVIERWVGTYATAEATTHFIDAPEPTIRLVMVTGGTGASMGFGIAEKTFATL